MKTKDLVEKFIREVKNNYQNLYVDYDYDEENNEYKIWHNNPELEFNSSQFKDKIAKISDKIFFSNNIFNFYFIYDYEESMSIRKTNYYFQKKDIDFQIKTTVESNSSIMQYSKNKRIEEPVDCFHQDKVRIEFRTDKILETQIKFEEQTSVNSKSYTWKNIDKKILSQEMELAS